MPALQLELRRLAPEDAVDTFTCGDAATDRFLRYHALPSQHPRRLSSTWVALRGGVVAGYLTTATCTLDRVKFPDAALQRRLPSYPLVALRVPHLGVALDAQRRGLGTALIARAEALARLLGSIGSAPVAGLVVDAPEASAAFLERRGFMRLGGRILEGALHGGPAPFFRPLGSAPAAEP
jgi:GNAT superfamily N-acetyltransferase